MATFADLEINETQTVDLIFVRLIYYNLGSISRQCNYFKSDTSDKRKRICWQINLFIYDAFR